MLFQAGVLNLKKNEKNRRSEMTSLKHVTGKTLLYS